MGWLGLPVGLGAEGLAQLTGRGEALIELASEGSGEERVEPRGELGPPGGGRTGGLVEDLLDHLAHVLPREGQLSREHPVEEDADGPEIAP